MSMTHLTDEQMLAAARLCAHDAMPYFRAGVLGLSPRAQPDMPHPMAVTNRSVLLYRPDLVRQWTPAQCGTVLLHEYMHLFLRHEQRFTAQVALGRLTLSAEDRALWNTVADAEINDDLEDAGLPFPALFDPNGAPLTHITPKGLGHPPHLLAEEYLLLELAKRPPPQDQGGAGDQDEGGPEPGGSGSVCAGGCGSGAGNPTPGEPPPEAEDGGRDEAEQEDARRRVMGAMADAPTKGKGSLPLGLQRYVDAARAPAKVRWQAVLARRVRAAVAFIRGRNDYTRTRPSRRQAALPAGGPVLPGMHSPLVEVALCIDTSGSMMGPALVSILNEAEGLLRALSGARVTVVSGDAAVQGTARARRVEEVAATLKGGGGTDFRPLFTEVARRKPRPSLVVFATDGYGAYPDGPPPGMDVVWLNVGGQIGVDWGTVVAVPEDDR